MEHFTMTALLEELVNAVMAVTALELETDESLIIFQRRKRAHAWQTVETIKNAIMHKYYADE